MSNTETTSRRPSVIDIDYAGSDTQQIICPVCAADNYVHKIGAAFEIHGSDDFKNHFKEGLEYRTHFRENGSAMSFWCEMCTHRWELIIQSHKGQTYVYTNRLDDQPYGVNT